jgi:hypothetical protein
MPLLLHVLELHVLEAAVAGQPEGRGNALRAARQGSNL